MPDKALSLICEKLEESGLQVRKHYHGYELAEVVVRNPGSLERGDMSINQDGFTTWEHTATISDSNGIREIVDVIKVLLATTAPSETGSHTDQPPSAFLQETLNQPVLPGRQPGHPGDSTGRNSMTMTLDDGAGIDAASMTSDGLMNEISEMLARQGFDVRRSDSDDGGRLTITNAPKGRCELDVSDSGWVTCDYFPWASEHAYPADISRAVLRLLAVSPDEPAGDHVDLHPKTPLKGAVGCAMRARGLTAELRMSADEMDFSVYAEVAITNPEQPGRGVVCVTDEGNIWWQCQVDELTGHAREVVMTLTDMLAPPVSRVGVVT